MPTPPSTTAGTVPNHCAVTPDSNCPTSFEAPMKTVLTALTRPRMSFGVVSCTSVCRTMMLTMSQAPTSTRAATESATLRESPNTTVKPPYAQTHHSIAAPARRRKGQCANTSAIVTAPMPGAQRSRPSPEGPIFRISRA